MFSSFFQITMQRVWCGKSIPHPQASDEDELDCPKLKLNSWSAWAAADSKSSFDKSDTNSDKVTVTMTTATMVTSPMTILSETMMVITTPFDPVSFAWDMTKVCRSQTLIHLDQLKGVRCSTCFNVLQFAELVPLMCCAVTTTASVQKPCHSSRPKKAVLYTQSHKKHVCNVDYEQLEWHGHCGRLSSALRHQVPAT